MSESTHMAALKVNCPKRAEVIREFAKLHAPSAVFDYDDFSFGITITWNRHQTNECSISMNLYRNTMSVSWASAGRGVPEALACVATYQQAVNLMAMLEVFLRELPSVHREE